MRTPAGLCAALALVAAGAAAAQPSETPALPVGPLALIGGGGGAVVFVDQTRSARTGTTADAWTVIVTDPPVHGASFNYLHQSIDCAARTITLVGAWGFDEKARSVVKAPGAPQQPIRPGSLGDLIAGHVCDGKRPMKMVTGYAAALDAAERMITENE